MKRKVVKAECKKLIEDWIGPIENLDRIRISNVYGDKYRVDVFIFKQIENSYYSKLEISKSYFLKVKDNKIVDQTKGLVNG